MYTCMYTCIKICTLCVCVALTSEKIKRGGGGFTVSFAILKAFIIFFFEKSCKRVVDKSKSCASLVCLFLADKRIYFHGPKKFKCLRICRADITNSL